MERINAQRPADQQALDDIQSPDTPFVFRDERLGFAELLGEVNLRHSHRMTGFDDEPEELFVGGRETEFGGLGHPVILLLTSCYTKWVYPEGLQTCLPRKDALQTWLAREVTQACVLA